MAVNYLVGEVSSKPAGVTAIKAGNANMNYLNTQVVKDNTVQVATLGNKISTGSVATIDKGGAGAATLGNKKSTVQIIDNIDGGKSGKITYKDGLLYDGKKGENVLIESTIEDKSAFKVGHGKENIAVIEDANASGDYYFGHEKADVYQNVAINDHGVYSAGITSAAIGGNSIRLNADQLSSNKQKLKEAADEVTNLWKDMKGTHISDLKNSWAGADAQSYIDKIEKFDSKVNAAAEALNLLADAFEKAAKELLEAQSSIKSSIDKL